MKKQADIIDFKDWRHWIDEDGMRKYKGRNIDIAIRFMNKINLESAESERLLA